MNKRKFNKIREENPERRISKRTLEYQKTRDDLAKVLKKQRRRGKTNDNNETEYSEEYLLEKQARIDYLVEKTFSEEPLQKDDYDFIISLPKGDLEEFINKIKWTLVQYRNAIVFMSEIHEDAPYDSDVQAFVAWNKLIEYIADKRDDVRAEKISIHTWHTDIEV